MSWDPDSPSEDASGYDGAFSYATEFHAFGIGLALGFVSAIPVPKLRKFVYRIVGLGESRRSFAIREARAESPYALFGVILGYLAGFALDAGVAIYAIGLF